MNRAGLSPSERNGLRIFYVGALWGAVLAVLLGGDGWRAVLAGYGLCWLLSEVVWHVDRIEEMEASDAE